MTGPTYSYYGAYELDIDSGRFELPETILRTWMDRNRSPRNKHKNLPIYFNSKLSYEGNSVLLTLLDPAITRVVIESGAKDYEDFLDVNPKEGSETLRKRLILGEDRNIEIPKIALDKLGIGSRVSVLGNDDYVELWNVELWRRYRNFEQEDIIFEEGNMDHAMVMYPGLFRNLGYI